MNGKLSKEETIARIDNIIKIVEAFKAGTKAPFTRHRLTVSGWIDSEYLNFNFFSEGEEPK